MNNKILLPFFLLVAAAVIVIAIFVKRPEKGSNTNSVQPEISEIDVSDLNSALEDLDFIPKEFNAPDLDPAVDF